MKWINALCSTIEFLIVIWDRSNPFLVWKFKSVFHLLEALFEFLSLVKDHIEPFYSLEMQLIFAFSKNQVV